MNLDLLNQFAQQHPIYYGVASFLAGAIAPKLLDLICTSGVDYVVLAAIKAQKRYLIAKGATPEQIKALEQRESQVLNRAAQDIQNDAGAQPDK